MVSERLTMGGLLAEQVLLAHDGPAWHGPALAEQLDGLSAAEASAHPFQGVHSIWEIVLHCAAWAGEVRRRLEGGSPDLPEEGDWPPVPDVSEAAWVEARARLRSSHELLAAAVRAAPDALWSDPVGGERDAPLGTGVSHAGMLCGLLQHSAYHGGQLALLRRAVRARPDSS